MADHGLTAAQRRRLAREMRKLAMECVEGRAPKLSGGWDYFESDNVCAIRCAAVRARSPIVDWSWWKVLGFLPRTLGFDALDAVTLVANENDLASDTDRPFAVVFPLLAAADAIEAADV